MKFMPRIVIDPLLTVEEVADFLALELRSIYKLIAQKELRATKVMNRWRIRRRDLEAYLRRNANR